jgi:hypothetical protein
MLACLLVMLLDCLRFAFVICCGFRCIRCH